MAAVPPCLTLSETLIYLRFVAWPARHRPSMAFWNRVTHRERRLPDAGAPSPAEIKHCVFRVAEYRRPVR
jgi:hypothetical protein